MEARTMDQTFREHEGDDMFLWLDDELADDDHGQWIEPAATVRLTGDSAATEWTSRLRAFLSLPTITP
jgi:hypothetical protein